MQSYLPPSPFDGQIFIDANRVQWKWDAKAWLWKRSGYADSLPLATPDTAGLMHPEHKAILDRIPPASGGFGITISPPMINAAIANPSGALIGDITLCSESLDITPVDRNGRPLAEGRFVSADTSDTSLMGGFQVSLSDKFLDSFCMEIVTFPGGEGEQGDQGLPGRDGFNDAPAGVPGLPGDDAVTLDIFSGIKLVELDEIQKTAIVDLGFDPTTNTLTAHHASVKVPTANTPADKLVITPVSRHLSYSISSEIACRATLDDWVLSVPNDDQLPTDADLYVFKVPDTTAAGEEVALEITRLSDLISSIVAPYKAKLDEFDKDWLLEAKEFIQAQDEAARTELSNLAQQLAECEFARPIQFALGVDPPAEDGPTPPGPGSGTPPPQAFLKRTAIIAIYDESESYYTGDQQRYETDKAAWDTKVQNLKAHAGWDVRVCLMQPVNTGVNPTPTLIAELQNALKFSTSTFPGDTDRAVIDVYTINNQTGNPDPSTMYIRVTPTMIVNAYKLLTTGGYVPTLLVFLLDNSGSMTVYDDYGGDTTPPETGTLLVWSRLNSKFWP